MHQEELKKAFFLLANPNDRDTYEMESLSLAAGFKMDASLSQNIKRIDKSYYFGKGKMDELVANILFKEEDMPIILNVSLSSTQKRNIEEITNHPVIDRTELIFIIFKKGARTTEAKLQVEIAELKYLSSQLVNEEANYAQVTSGSGHNKGSGEKQKELSRREIFNAIKQKEKQLEAIKKARKTGRNKRNQSPLPLISVVGYTNAGKSTLINGLLSFSKKKPSKDVLAKDQLFATLETSARLIDVYNYPSFIITDTVGFISNLPHFLVSAFRSTLEEIKESDFIIEVVDVSSSYFLAEMAITESVLNDLGAKDIPRIYIYNKIDKLVLDDVELSGNEIFTSLNNPDEIPSVFSFILDNITSTWVRKTIVFPHEFDFREFSKDNYVVSKIQKKEGIQCLVYFNPKTIHKYQSYFAN